MKSKFILELQKGISVLIEAESVEEARKQVKQQFGKTSQGDSTAQSEKKDLHVGLYGHLLSLKEEGFFVDPKTLNDIRQRLKELAVHYPSTTFPPYLNRLIKKRILRRFQENKEGKKFWVYVNI